MVLVTRDDLKLSKGKLAAQCSHAAVNCAMKAKRKAARLYERWNNFGARKIVVRADDESHLRQLYAKALEGYAFQNYNSFSSNYIIATGSYETDA